jgi:PAS domain S-box-containing protein
LEAPKSAGGAKTAIARDERGRLTISADADRERAAFDKLDMKEAAKLFSNLPIGLALTHPDGNLIAFNESLCKSSGYTGEELANLGQLAQLFDDPNDGAKAFAHAYEKGFLYGGEMRFRRKDGSCYFALFSLRAILVNETRYWQAIIEDISDQKRAEQALRASEENYRALYDDNPSMYFTVDWEGIVLSVNRFGAEQLGYSVEELVGQSVFNVFIEDDRNIVQQQLTACLQHPHQVFHWELRKIRKDGSILWVKEAARAVPGVDGELVILIVCEDISERKRVEQALREGEQRYRGLVESFPYAIFVEQDGRLVFVNSVGLRLMNCNAVSDLQGLGLPGLFGKGREKGLERFLWLEKHDFQPSLMEWTECKLLRKNGEVIDVEVIFLNTNYEGKPAIQAIARDITETKTLRQAAQKMERLAALGEISTTIAHEIRNPLSSISLNLQYLSRHLQIPETLLQIFQNIRQGVTIIQNIVSGILDFARLAPPAFKTTDIHRVLENSLNYVKVELELAGIEVRKEYMATRPNAVMDPNQMVQVFVNLLSNAKDAMDGGGTLFIRTTCDGNSVEVQIEDTGKGIPQQNLAKIFNPFFTTKANGIGLGLAIVLRILEQHQAEIKVESEVDVGTKCAIKLSATPEYEPP